MQKNLFHNKKILDENDTKKEKPITYYTNPQIPVDINILLNKVKIENKNKRKKSIVLLGFVVLIVGVMGIFVSL